MADRNVVTKLKCRRILCGMLKVYRHVWVCYGSLQTMAELRLTGGNTHMIRRRFWSESMQSFSLAQPIRLTDALDYYGDVNWIFVSPQRHDAFVIELEKIEYKALFFTLNRMLRATTWEPFTSMRWVTMPDWHGGRRWYRLKLWCRKEKKKLADTQKLEPIVGI